MVLQHLEMQGLISIQKPFENRYFLFQILKYGLFMLLRTTFTITTTVRIPQYTSNDSIQHRIFVNLSISLTIFSARIEMLHHRTCERKYIHCRIFWNEVNILKGSRGVYMSSLSRNNAQILNLAHSRNMECRQYRKTYSKKLREEVHTSPNFLELN